MTVRYLQRCGWAFRHAQHLWKQATSRGPHRCNHKRDIQVRTHFECGGDQVKVGGELTMCGMRTNIRGTTAGFVFEHTSRRAPFKESMVLHCFTTLTLRFECIFSPSEGSYSSECIWIVNETPAGIVDVFCDGKKNSFCCSGRQHTASVGSDPGLIRYPFLPVVSSFRKSSFMQCHAQ